MPEKPAGSPWETVWFIGTLIFAIALVWYFNNGASRSSLNGIFIHPPAPVGSGESYGPTLGNTPTLQENYYYQESTSTQ
jgi:hypothetical protein